MMTYSSANIPINSISITDDWYITHSSVFPDHSSSTNLSKELINCVRIEQDEYEQLLHEYQRVVDLLKQRNQEMSERLTVFKEFYEELMKINQADLAKDLLNSYMWNNLYKMTDSLENLCSKMIDTKTHEDIHQSTDHLDLSKLFRLSKRTTNSA